MKQKWKGFISTYKNSEHKVPGRKNLNIKERSQVRESIIGLMFGCLVKLV